MIEHQPPEPSEVLRDLTPQAFAQWKHHPVTAVYLKFLEDQAVNFRNAAADLWESGMLDPASANPNLNANVVRGRLLALRELHSLGLSDIRRFYGLVSEEARADERTRPDQGPAG